MTCSICKHRKLKAIDEALRAGLSLRTIALLADVSKDGLRRHNLHRSPKNFMRRRPLNWDALPPAPSDLDIEKVVAANWRPEVEPLSEPTEGG